MFPLGFVEIADFCGVRVHNKVDHMIVLDQTTYVNSGINSFNVDTHRDLDRFLTSAEITNLRGVWCALGWVKQRENAVWTSQGERIDP